MAEITMAKQLLASEPCRLPACFTIFDIRRARAFRLLSVRGPSAWNAVHACLKDNTVSLSTFRRQLKHFYFSFYLHSERVQGYFTVTGSVV